MRSFAVIFVLYGFFLLAVLNVYFKSNVQLGLVSYENDNYTPTKRIVLFVIDGLPANYFYTVSKGSTNTPFMRSVIENNGVWGLSYTRVPTESRPGHIAVIAGLYEDPSAVFKGWKENPVLFDSVFNQTEATFTWGCHDILHLFQKGSKRGNIFLNSYPSNMQDYSGKHGAASALDDWVLDKFTEFENELHSNSTLFNMVNSPRVVLFFHLLGVDVAGHASKPKTSEYNYTIKNADRVVESLVQKIDTLFNDSETTYVFTSDHGMTDWGSHGAGSSIETITPIVVWGAGIKKPINVTNDLNVLHTNDNLNTKVQPTPDDWRLSHLLRYDMNQADIAVLMSIILGVPIPVNSVGVLPMHVLDIPHENIAKGFLLNAKQLMEQLLALEKDFTSNLTPFLFSCHDNLCYTMQNPVLEYIENTILPSDPDQAVNMTRTLIFNIIRGMNFYESYFRNIILGHIFFGFLSIILYILGEITSNVDYSFLPKGFAKKFCLPKIESQSVEMLNGILIIIGITIVNLIYLTFLGGILPIHYLCYVFGSLVLTFWSLWSNSLVILLPKFFSLKGIFKNVIFFAVAIQLLILCFFERWILSVMLLMFCLWPFIDSSLRICLSRNVIALWVGSCLSLSVFPLLPIVGNEELIIVKIMTGMIWFCILGFFLIKPPSRHAGIFNPVTIIQLAATPSMLYNMYCISLDYEVGQGLGMFNQVASFIFLFIFLASMPFGSSSVYPRLLNLSYSVGMSFLLFSLSYEALFPLCLTINLLCWLYFEENISTRRLNSSIYHYMKLSGMIQAEDFRRSFIYLFYIFVSFFGIGNLASLNSFDTNWTRNFVATFSPFTMMVLILLRTMLPFFLVTFALRCLVFQTIEKSKKLFLIVLLYCDLMAAQLLYRVNNVGSWLEIGTSLTQFIIMESIVLFLLVLYYLVKKITYNLHADNVPLPKYD